MFEGLWESRFQGVPATELNSLQSKCNHQCSKCHIVKGWLGSQHTSDGGLWSGVFPAGLCLYIFWDWEVNQKDVGAGGWYGVGSEGGQKRRAWNMKRKTSIVCFAMKKDSWPMATLSQLQKHECPPNSVLCLFCHPLIIICLSLYTLWQENIRWLYWNDCESWIFPL